MGYWSVSSAYHGFLGKVGGAFATFDAPGGANNTWAYGINDSGQVVGVFSDATGAHGFLRDPTGTSYTTIDVPFPSTGQVKYTVATGINNRGQIVGFFSDASYNYHGFIRDVDGTFTQIDVPGASNPGYAFPFGINDSGWIVGYFWNATGSHGFLRRLPPVIAIDAGHGRYRGVPVGEAWNGAVGPTGLREDNVVLDIAQRVAADLRAKGYVVIETRTDIWLLGLSESLDLAKRVKIATKDPGGPSDIFVSIHLNSACGFTTDGRPVCDSSLNGTEVWIDPRYVENKSTSLAEGIAAAQANLSQTPPLALRTGNRNKPGVKEVTLDDPWKNKSIYVLKGMGLKGKPSALSEVAFVSNPNQEQLFYSATYRQQVAIAISGAITQYLAK